ncbi:unnamed protein product [Victoria cruziana]
MVTNWAFAVVRMEDPSADGRNGDTVYDVSMYIQRVSPNACKMSERHRKLRLSTFWKSRNDPRSVIAAVYY